jgi:two-component system LytT family response regulator
MISCIIIEDDLLAQESLSYLIENKFHDKLKLVGVAGTLLEGINLIKQKMPELVFLDIELPDESGFSVFNYFPNAPFEVIFTTSGPEYAVTAIKHMAVDYLIKPVGLIDLGAALVRLDKRNSAERLANEAFKKMVENFKMGTSYQEKIALPTPDGFQIIPFNEILYCQASESYAYICTKSKEKILVTKTLKNLEEQLPSSCFYRIHKSILLNINYVKSFSRKDGFIVTLETGQKFEVATRRQEEFTNFLIKKQPFTEPIL